MQALKRSLQAALVLGLLVVVSLRGPQPTRSAVPDLIDSAHAAPTPVASERHTPSLLYDDPLAFLKEARLAYDIRVRDYVCRCSKREQLGGVLGPWQVSEAKFREGPFSVFLHILENADKARRVLYVKDQRVREGSQ